MGFKGDVNSLVCSLKSWRALVAVTNLFDNCPDFWAASGGAWNPRCGQPFGRTCSSQLTGRF
jgi:hypothetical protein